MADDFTGEEKRGFYKAVYSRRDVRSHFTSQPIADDILAKILHAAHHAPSVGFSQPWNFVLIKNPATKKKIKESFVQEKNRSSQLLDQTKKAKYLSFKLEGILESPVNICVTYDPTKFGPFVIGRSSIPQAGLYSVCCAIQNLWLAARVENIGLGWVSILANETLKETLNLPEYVIPVAYLCLGYVADFAKKPDLETGKWLPRLDLADVIYFEKWANKKSVNWHEMQSIINSDF